MSRIEIVVAGHVCLDIFPAFNVHGATGPPDLKPGTLGTMGPIHLSTGGAVANTGLALHRLGVPVALVGKIGRDRIGRIVLDLLRDHDPGLADGIIESGSDSTSCTVVLEPPGADRTFLHHTGANDTFGADDVDLEALAGARLFHLGYPTVMKRLYENGGRELAALFHKVKDRGLTTSLDMSAVDPRSPAAAVDWPGVLERELPHVDVFMPSYEEILSMLVRDRSAAAAGTKIDSGILTSLADRLLARGVSIVGLKLGDQGLYLRTGAVGDCAPEAARSWAHRELIAPCFKVREAGTVGSGDCTIAGFLAGLVRGIPLEEAATQAVAVGACSVEQVDGVGGIPSLAEVQRRIQAGWERRPQEMNLSNWRWMERENLWSGPRDSREGKP